jgi:(R,R)-butanediol dehydrogenase/meso-butanediol dehydrogenase/diacetyl reductase
MLQRQQGAGHAGGRDEGHGRGGDRVHLEPSATINVHSVVMKELDVRGTIAYCNDHQETIQLVEQGKINLEPFITQRIQLDDLVSQGFDTLIHNNESAVKIVVQPRFKAG